MSEVTVIPQVAANVVSDSTTWTTVLRSRWVLLFGGSKLRTVLNMQNGSTNLEARTKFLTADVLTSETNTVSSASGATLDADGYKTDDLDVSAETSAMWVQAIAQVSSSSGVSDGRLVLSGTLHSEGRIVASQDVNVGPTTAESGTSQYHYLPIGRPVPIVGMSSIMYAVVYTVGSGTVYWQPVYRTFTNDLNKPSTWATKATEQTGSSNTTWNSGTVTLADVTTKAMWQPGIRWKSESGSGSLKIIVAAKY